MNDVSRTCIEAKSFAHTFESQEYNYTALKTDQETFYLKEIINIYENSLHLQPNYSIKNEVRQKSIIWDCGYCSSAKFYRFSRKSTKYKAILRFSHARISFDRLHFESQLFNRN